MKKRIVSLLLALLICAGMMPTSALASGAPLATLSCDRIELAGGDYCDGEYRATTPNTVTLSEEALALPGLDCLIFYWDAIIQSICQKLKLR